MPTNKVAKDDTLQSLVSAVEDIAELMGDGVINDSSTAADKTWSASKENTTVNGLKSNVIANTKLIKDTVGWTNKNIGKYVNQSLVGDSTAGFNLVSGGSSLIAKLEHNKDYIVKRKSGQGDRFRVVLFINAPSVMSPDTSASQAVFDNTKNEYTISSGNYNYAVFTYVSSSSTAISQDTAEAMIYDADILDDTYEPYFGSTAFPRSEQAVLGAKNFALPDVLHFALAGTVGSSVFVANDAVTGFCAKIEKNTDYTWDYVSGDRYRLALSANYPVNNGVCNIEYVNDTGVKTHTFNSGNYEYAYLYCYNNNDKTYDEIKPLCTLTSDTDRTFVPYAMANKELTENGINFIRTLSSSDDVDNIKKTGWYQILTAPTNAPESKAYSIMEVFNYSGLVVQRYTRAYEGIFYIRVFSDNAWRPWFKFTGTQVA